MTAKRCLAALVCLVICLMTLQLQAAGQLVALAGKGAAGNDDGQLLTATFRMPYGLTADANGNLIVADSYNNRLRRIADGQVTTMAGRISGLDSFGFPQGGLVDGTALRAYFNRPRGLTVDAAGNVYVTDSQNHVIRVLTPQGQVRTMAGTGQPGYVDGSRMVAQFSAPAGLALDPAGNLYVADTLNHVIRRVTPAGVVSTFAGAGGADGGYLDGAAAVARFNEPAALAFAPDGALLVADAGNQLIRRIAGGQVSTLAGQYLPDPDGGPYAQAGFVDGSADTARFNFPKGLAVAENGVVFIADTWNQAIRAITLDLQVITLHSRAAAGEGALAVDGPVGLVYRAGNLYIADQWANAIYQLEADAANLIPVTLPTALEEPEIPFDQDTSAIQVWLDGQRVAFPDEQPLLTPQGTTLVPLRSVLQRWGADVRWEHSGRVIVRRGETDVTFEPGDARLINVNGRMLVGIRHLAQSFGFQVDWVAQHRAVVIKTR